MLSGRPTIWVTPPSRVTLVQKCGFEEEKKHASCAKKAEKTKRSKGLKFWVHTYPTVSSSPTGSCVQSLVQIGSEMWICIRYEHTHTHKLTFSFIYKIHTDNYMLLKSSSLSKMDLNFNAQVTWAMVFLIVSLCTINWLLFLVIKAFSVSCKVNLSPYI
jgi:hypothetical protein